MEAAQRIKAIVYTSETGHTKEYAQLFARQTGLPAYDLKTAKGALPQHCKIIYMGWLMAGSVKGYKEAANCFTVKALCGVGMARTGSQDEDIRKNNNVPEGTPVFSLQGGFQLEKLHGVYKMMMKVMKATAGKGLANKQDRTPEEDDMLDLLQNGGDRVNAENLSDLQEWYESYCK